MGRRTRVELRWLLTVMLFGALGLATSVAVAWGATVWYVDEVTTFPGRSGLGGSPVVVTSGLQREIENDTSVYSFELRSGWPAHCLRLSNVGEDRRRYGIGRQYSGAIYGGLDVSMLRRAGRVEYLPREPIYANLLLDSAFWAVIWLLFCTIGNVARLNRWIRMRGKKLCGWCGYNVRDLPERRCPECGHAIERWPSLFRHPARWPAVLALVVLAFGLIVFINHFRANGLVESIHRAAFQGDLKSVRAELARGADIDLMLQDPAYFNCSPLILAAWNGHETVIEYLLQNGPDVTIVGDHGNALTAAVRSRNPALVKRLIKAGIPINVQAGDHREPLIAAIQVAELESIELLLEECVDVTTRDVNGSSPLDYALFTRRIERERRAEIVQLLLAAGADPNSPSLNRMRSPLAKAILAGYYELVRMLLEAGATTKDRVALEEAAGMTDTTALAIMVEYGADLAANDPRGGLSLLWYVNRNPYQKVPEVWWMLVKHGADVNTVLKWNGRSLLIDAVLYDQKAFATFLLEHGADPTIVDNAGRRAVDYIPSSTRESELKALLEEYEAKWIAEYGGDEREAASRGAGEAAKTPY